MRYKVIILLFILALIVNSISSQASLVKWWDETVYSSLGYDLKDSPLDYTFSKWADRNPDWWDKAGFRAPLLSYSLAFVNLITNSSAVALDFFIPTIGALGVVLLYLLVKKMFNKKLALYSSLFLTFIPLHIIYSGKILADVLLTTLITATFLSFWLGFEKKKVNFKILTGLLIGLSILSKYTAIILLPTIFIYLLIKNKNLKFLKDKYLGVSIIVLLLTLTPLFLYGQSSYDTPLGAFIHGYKASSYWGASSPWHFFVTNSVVMFSVVAILLLVGLVKIIKKFKFKNHNQLLILIWFIAFLIIFSSLSHKEDRYFLPIAPVVCIIAAIGLDSLKYKKALFVITMTVLILSALSGIYFLYYTSHGEDSTCFLQSNAFLRESEDNSVIFTDSSPIVYYYTKMENHYYTSEFRDMTKLIEEHYSGRPVYVLWSQYDFPTDFREDLDQSDKFEVVHRCPEDGNLSLVYKYFR